MRILLTVPSLGREFGGPSAKAMGLASALESLGHSVDVVGCGQDGSLGLPVLGRYHGTPIPRTLGPLLRAVGRAEVVHVIGYRDPVGTVAALAAQRVRVPYVIEPVGMYRRRIRSLTLKASFDATVGRTLVRRAKAFVATSRLEARELVEDGIRHDRIKLRPNGVDVAGLLPLPQRAASRQRFGLPLEAPVVLALGRITRKKGLRHLLEALVQLPDLWALVAGPDDGDGTLSEVMRVRARRDLSERVVVHPISLWNRDKAQALAAADCFCLPSATENFGTAAAEAAAVGLPVVVSDLCGASEWLDPAASRTVPYGDVGALVAALSGLLDSRSPLEAARGAPRIRSSLDWHALAARQVEIYEETQRP